MIRYLLLFVLLFSPFSLYGKEILTVHTYASFISPVAGPGPFLKEAFEKTCPACEIKFVAADTLPLLLNRLRLEGNRTTADVVVGLEDLVLDPVFFDTPVAYSSYCLAFIYDSEKISNPPHSLEELITSSHKVILQDPRTSITGFGGLVWMKKVYGEKAGEKWKALSSHVLTFTKGCSDSAALFKKGEAPIVLGYTTDALYHELKRGQPHIKALQFSDGHLCSHLYAAKTKVTKKGALADKFIKFLLTPEAQEIISTKGWGYPASGQMPEAWRKAENFFPLPPAIPYTFEEIKESQKEWIQEWIDGQIQ